MPWTLSTSELPPIIHIGNEDFNKVPLPTISSSAFFQELFSNHSYTVPDFDFYFSEAQLLLFLSCVLSSESCIPGSYPDPVIEGRSFWFVCIGSLPLQLPAWSRDRHSWPSLVLHNKMLCCNNNAYKRPEYVISIVLAGKSAAFTPWNSSFISHRM